MLKSIKINPEELLSRIANSQGSGCLELSEGLVSWKVYFQHGNLKYIDCSVQLLDQIRYYLYYLGSKQALKALRSTPYGKIQSYKHEKPCGENLYSQVICWLLAEQHLDAFEGWKLIESITKDTLRSCLWLKRGTFLWYVREPIPFWIRERYDNRLSLSVSECLNAEQIRLKQWQNYSKQLLSVHQRPYFASGWQQKSLPVSGLLNYPTLRKLSQVMQGRTSIRQLSLLLRKDELRVAKILSPYIDEQIIYLRNPQSPLDLLPDIPRIEQNNQQSTPNKKRKIIVSVDDSPIILQEISRFLPSDRYKITAVNDPVQAVSKIFRLDPDLILLDITMPRINGYKLCGLLRNSGKCDDVPIVMVTANTGLINKARAKMAGATDYVTKPFTQEKLLEIIEKYT